MATIKEDLEQIVEDYLNGFIGITECYHKTIDDTVRWYTETLGLKSCPTQVTDDALNYVNSIIMKD